MDLLSNPKFVITTSYGVVSMLMYAVVVHIIVKNSNNYNGSFFIIFVAGFFMNFLTYVNSFITLRIPQNTKITGYFASFFLANGLNSPNRHFPLNIFHTFHFQFAYTQYLFNFITCVNRASVIFFPMNSEKVWKKFTWLILLIIFVGPFVTTINIFNHDSYYEYSNASDYFVATSSWGRNSIYSVLMPVLVMITISNVLINGGAYWKLLYRTQIGKHMEKSLLKMSTCVFFIDIFLATLTVSNYFLSSSKYENLIFISYYTQASIPFASDALTLLHPWLMIVFGPGIRKKIFGRAVAALKRTFLTNLHTSVSTSAIVEDMEMQAHSQAHSQKVLSGVRNINQISMSSNWAGTGPAATATLPKPVTRPTYASLTRM